MQRNCLPFEYGGWAGSIASLFCLDATEVDVGGCGNTAIVDNSKPCDSRSIVDVPYSLGIVEIEKA